MIVILPSCEESNTIENITDLIVSLLYEWPFVNYVAIEMWVKQDRKYFLSFSFFFSLFLNSFPRSIHQHGVVYSFCLFLNMLIWLVFDTMKENS